jgi:hypothetical protein
MAKRKIPFTFDYEQASAFVHEKKLEKYKEMPTRENIHKQRKNKKSWRGQRDDT